MAVIEGVYVFLNIVSDRRYVRILKFLIYLGVRAPATILPGCLYVRDLLLPELSSCFIAIVFHRVSIESPFRLLQDFKRRNSRYK